MKMKQFLVVIPREKGGVELYPLKDWLRHNPRFVPPGMHPSNSTSHQLRNGLKKLGWTVRETDTEVHLVRPSHADTDKLGAVGMSDMLYAEFQDPSYQFLREPRAFCYDLATQFVNEARQTAGDNWYDDIKTVKGILLLLFTWNFAARATKKLTFANVGRLIRDSKEDLKCLEQFSIEDADERVWDVTKKVFANFKKLLGQTGASKALSLLNSRLFVMWDTDIRKRLRKELIPGINNGKSPEDYVTFLKGIQRIIKDYRISEKLPSGSIVAKKIDEYHYVKIKMLPNSSL